MKGGEDPMLGVGGGTLIKLVIKEDGGPNWFGISFLGLLLLGIFVWRCLVFIPENWVAIRRRFNRVVRDESGMPLEYDPLMDREDKPGKKVRNFRFRVYLLNSLVLVNTGTRETNLNIDAVSLLDMDYDTVFSAAWNVSRAHGNPTKSYLKPAESKWRWKSEKDELEQLVRKYVADAVLKAYEDHAEGLVGTPTRLPEFEFDTNKRLTTVRDFLLKEFGVEFTGVLYGQRSVSPARRNLEGYRLLAAAQRAIADAIRGASPLSVDQESEEENIHKVAVAGGATVLDLHSTGR